MCLHGGLRFAPMRDYFIIVHIYLFRLHFNSLRCTLSLPF